MSFRLQSSEAFRRWFTLYLTKWNRDKYGWWCWVAWCLGSFGHAGPIRILGCQHGGQLLVVGTVVFETCSCRNLWSDLWGSQVGGWSSGRENDKNYIRVIWVFPKIGAPQNGWFIMENPIKMGWFGGTPIFGNIHIRNFKWRWFWFWRFCHFKLTWWLMFFDVVVLEAFSKSWCHIIRTMLTSMASGLRTAWSRVLPPTTMMRTTTWLQWWIGRQQHCNCPSCWRPTGNA